VPTYYIPHKESKGQSSGLKISLSKCDIAMPGSLKTVLHVTLVHRSSQVLPTVAYFSSAFTKWQMGFPLLALGSL